MKVEIRQHAGHSQTAESTRVGKTSAVGKAGLEDEVLYFIFL
jgi:hypothetical protein